MDTVTSQATYKPLTLIGVFAVVSAAYFFSKILHTLYLHPLSRIPGPKLNAISRIPYVRHLLKGTTNNNVVELHQKYGSAVRVSPNEVSFTSIDTAFPDIYGFRTGKLKGHLNMQKDPVWYPKPTNGSPSILIGDDEYHSRGRKVLSHAFSEKALTEQEPLVQRYVDQLVDGLKGVTSTGPGAVDMTQWFNWTTFDVIADLLFGEPFGCLQTLETHKYIDLLFQNVVASHFSYIMYYWPWAKYFGKSLVDLGLVAKRVEFMGWVHSQVQKRCDRDTQRPDFMTHILAHNGKKGESLTVPEIDSNASLILIAGSETTATLLSGATYCLLKNPDKLEKLKQEVRGRWKNYSDITLAEVNNTPYLIAVLSEALRWFPPVPTGFERRVGKDGEVVSGYFLPEGTSVCVSHYAAYHSEANFKDADAFIPERWLDEPEYANDKRSAFQPFSFGPRNCLGKSLAYAEMRLIMAKLIWSFDLELMPKSRNWSEGCLVKNLWVKPELSVRVKDVVRQ